MTDVKFTDFAKMLYIYYGHGKKKSDFVKDLIDNIIGDDIENPISSYEPESLENWYYGTAKLPKEVASRILIN